MVTDPDSNISCAWATTRSCSRSGWASGSATGRCWRRTSRSPTWVSTSWARAACGSPTPARWRRGHGTRPQRGRARVPARRRRIPQHPARGAAQRRLRGDHGAAVLLRPGASLLLRELARSADPRIAEIAAKAVKEVDLSRRAQHRLGAAPGRWHGGVACAHAEGARSPVAVHRRDVRGRRGRCGDGRGRHRPRSRGIARALARGVDAVCAEATLDAPEGEWMQGSMRAAASRACTPSTWATC